MDETGKIKRGRGEHLKKDDVKIEIIKYILSKNVAVPGPDIIGHIKEKCKIVDEKNIRLHLKDLREKHCIEKFERKGFGNKWDINFKHLKNIKFNYKTIKLNAYERSLNIIIENCGYDIESLHGFKIYMQSLLSTSFFNECMETDIETLRSRAMEIYIYNEGLDRNFQIKKNMDELYYTFIELHPNSRISKEAFQKTMEEIVFQSGEMISWEIFSKMVKEKFPELSEEITLKMGDEFIEKKKQMARNNDEINSLDIVTEFSDEQSDIEGDVPGMIKEIYEKHPQMTEEDHHVVVQHEEMYMKMVSTLNSMLYQPLEFECLCFDILLEYFLYRDILTGVATPEELEYVKNVKYNSILYYDYESKDPIDVKFNKWVLGDLKQASIIMAKYKKPSIFDKKIYDNADDVYRALRDKFSFILDIFEKRETDNLT